MSGLHDGRIKALYLVGENPAQTEPNAHHVEEGLEHARVPRRAGPVPERPDREVRGRRLPRLELRREGRHVHEHRAAGQPRAPGGAVPGRGARRLRHRRRRWRGRSARTGPSTPTRRVRLERVRRPDAELVRASATTGSRRSGCSGRAPTATIPARSTSTRRARRGRTARASSIPVEYQPPIELPDSEYPFMLSTGRTLYHYNSATMTMREDGVIRQAGGPVLRDPPRGRGGARRRRRRLGAPRLAPRRPRGARARSATASTRASSGWPSTSRRRR